MKSCFIFVLSVFLSIDCRGRNIITIVDDPPQDSTYFSLTFSFYNHAELVYKGAVTYLLTSDYLGISRRNLFDKEDKALYSANIRKAVSDSLSALRLDTLRRYYHNPCILSTSGDEYFISIKKNDTEQRVYLHHYYHPLVERLVGIINALVPEEYSIPYLKKETKQDCE